MGVLIALTGIETAQRCLAAARAVEGIERDAWQRLAKRYMRKREVTRTDDWGVEPSGCEVGQLAGTG